MWSFSEIAYYVGITIVLLTHFYILWKGGMPQSQSIQHAYINLAAAFLIIFYFVSNKGYISA
jgi:hypothetical protein